MDAREQETIEETEERRERVREATMERRQKRWQNKINSAMSYDPQIDYANDPSMHIGDMTIECKFCHAFKWKGETPGMCCKNGKVRLADLSDPPEQLQNLLTNTDEDSIHFQKNTRRYNSCFQMTSFGASKVIREPGFMPTFKVQGQVYHRIGGLLPLEDEEPKFLQVYFTGNKEQEIQHRLHNIPGVKASVVGQLQDLLHNSNNYVKGFKTAMETMSPDYRVLIHADKTPAGEHSGRYNAPVDSEVAVIMVGENHGSRDIVLQLRDNTCKRIVETHRSYDALQYPFLVG